MAKKLMIAGVVILALAAGWFFLLRGGPTDAAEKWLATIGAGKAADAYQMMDLSFQAATDQESFLRAVKQMKLDRYASVAWAEEKREGESASLTGAVTLTDGGTVPVEVNLIRSEGDWRVSSLGGSSRKDAPRLGFEPVHGETILTAPEPAVKTRVPSRPGLRYLSTETILKLNEAALHKDFRDFYSRYISRLWQKEVTPEQLQEVFGAFADPNLKLADVANVSPIFDMQPTVDERGFFIVSGNYPTIPPTIFQITYVFEDDQWKVFYMRVMK